MKALTCPACTAPLPLTGDFIIKCGYCGTVVILDESLETIITVEVPKPEPAVSPSRDTNTLKVALFISLPVFVILFAIGGPLLGTLGWLPVWGLLIWLLSKYQS